MKEIKNILRGKWMKGCITASLLVSALMVSAFASDSDPMAGITTSLTTGFADVSKDILAIVGIGVVAAMGVIGAKIAIKAGINFFKTLTGH